MIENYRILPIFTEFYRVLPSCTEFYRYRILSRLILLGFTEFFRYRISLPRCLGCSLISPSFTEFYRVLEVSYSVLAGITGFYRVWWMLSMLLLFVLLGFTEFFSASHSVSLARRLGCS